jgi:hypothetical protein
MTLTRQRPTDMQFLIAIFRRLRLPWRRSYDPSRYYMRGPGPASARRKRQSAGKGKDK